MAQKILIRRGSITNIGSTIAVTQGELLYGSGSTAGVENVLFVANADGNNTFVAVGQLYTGTASPTSFSARLDGLPYYHSSDKALYRLGNATPLDLSGNLSSLSGSVIADSGTSLTYSLISEALTFTTSSDHGFSFTAVDASNQVKLNTPQDLRTTANVTFAQITGSDLIVNGTTAVYGNILLGDADTDTISVGADFISNLVPDINDNYSLGTASKRWQIYGVNASITGSFNGTFDGLVNGGSPVVGTGSLNYVPKWTSNTTLGDSSIQDNGSTVTIGSNTDINGTVNISGNITLDAAGAQTITHTGAGDLTISSTSGDTYIEGTQFTGNNVIIPGNLTVQGTTTTVNSTEVNIGDNIITLNTVGTVADGGINVIDTAGTAHTGSLLWNATGDYWYAGISGSVYYRVATYENQSPVEGIIPFVSGSAKRLAASPLTYSGTALSSSADLSMEGNNITNIGSIAISGLTANSFIHTNASSTLTALTPALAGDLIQWNGTAFTASNVIDGGTF